MKVGRRELLKLIGAAPLAGLAEAVPFPLPEMAPPPLTEDMLVDSYRTALDRTRALIFWRDDRLVVRFADGSEQVIASEPPEWNPDLAEPEDDL